VIPARGQAHEAQKNLAAARASYRKALSADPGDTESVSALTRIDLAEGHLTRSRH